MDDMYERILKRRLADSLKNGMSFFLLGPRQTGKTTIVGEVLRSLSHVDWNLMETRERQKFEKDPSLIIQEVEAAPADFHFIDEVQKVPELLDNIQILIDEKKKIFALTGSSARKLRRENVNLLPGRTLSFRLDPLCLEEYRDPVKWNSLGHLKSVLRYGELPKAFTMVHEGRMKLAQELLYSYVMTYLEEEIRAEALVRNMGVFSRFLKLAAEESGRIVSFRAMSQDIGIPHATIAAYYQILEDCLIIERIDALIPAGTRGKVQKASKIMFFDTGVLNAAAEVLGSADYSSEYWGRLFEQWIGLTILKFMRSSGIHGRLHYWRDYGGREVDWVVERDGEWIPIEVKWGENINAASTRHLEYFLQMNVRKAKRGFVVFTGARSRKLDEKISIITPKELLTRVFFP
jgi:uncharacterized protein